MIGFPELIEALVHWGLITQEQGDIYLQKMQAEWDEWWDRREAFRKDWEDNWRKTTPWWKRWWEFGTPPAWGWMDAWIEHEHHAES